MNKTLKIILFSILLLVAIVAVWSLFFNKTTYSEEEVTFCNVDSDCVMVPYTDHCCSSSKAVNVAFVDYFANRPSGGCNQFSDAQCSRAPSAMYAECVQNKCVPKFN